MEITKIECQKNNKEKVNIYVDGEYFISMSINGIIENYLFEGKEIDKDNLIDIKNKDESNIAYIFMLDKISYKMHTEKEIRDKMIKKEFSEEAIDIAMNKARETNLINDSYYCELFIKQSININKYGKNVIYQKLLQKGINKDLIKEKIDEFIDDDKNYKNCIEIANKKLRTLNTEIDFKKAKDKLYRFLLSKGFDYDTISSVFYELFEN